MTVRDWSEFAAAFLVFLLSHALPARPAARRRIAAALGERGYLIAYGVVSLALGAGMLALAINVYRLREGREAARATRQLFAFSILYLFALFATLLIEVVARAVVPSVW